MLSRVNANKNLLKASFRNFSISPAVFQNKVTKTKTSEEISKEYNTMIVENVKEREDKIKEYKQFMKEAGYEQTIYDIKSSEDLFGPGPKDNTVPTEYEQATGPARFELLGKMAGIDIFDYGSSTPNRIGTPQDPIPVLSQDPYSYVGCGGIQDKNIHELIYLRPTTEEVARCPECGQCYKTVLVPGAGAHGGHGH
ncbi:hypothetical protein FOG50_00942 [Hanseniaspora uvarum]|jgi:cytochrome c oxidase subunit 5b|uniref:Cytochrome c oxidase subunit 4, mitochondrial n=1 Tax=Hanseniaspora uvarum TaxID=29833 RepID=A0A1E5RU18_HANUV|nr:hypothetical protein FOG48_01465 [Hanseniaspora uvarum]KAF0278211.1 hypothetical protein FOG50_00942 [Hanseniaspora uvarum]OEJ90375.1 Cytochrome c oxidase subunit 4, mitochondrial [Hanseniaspora uvarum]